MSRRIDNWREDDGSYDVEVFAECEECGKEIYFGSDYYEIGGKVYCEDCIHDARKVADDE